MSEHDGTAEYPPSIKVLASLVSKSGNTESIGPQHIVTLRVPLVTVTKFDAMAEYSSQSRSKLMVTALESALEQLDSHLPQQDRDFIDAIWARLLQERLANGDKAQSGEAA